MTQIVHIKYILDKHTVSCVCFSA